MNEIGSQKRVELLGRQPVEPDGETASELAVDRDRTPARDRATPAELPELLRNRSLRRAAVLLQLRDGLFSRLHRFQQPESHRVAETFDDCGSILDDVVIDTRSGSCALPHLGHPFLR